MDNVRRDNELELSRFGEYLLKSRIVKERHASYCVGWVRKFMVQVPPTPGLTIEDRITVFTENLRANIEPWQLDQAENSLTECFQPRISWRHIRFPDSGSLASWSG